MSHFPTETRKSPNKGSFSLFRGDAVNELAIQKIKNYMDECLYDPTLNWPTYWFRKQTYSRWTAGEILRDILDHPLTPATTTVENFEIRMHYFLYEAEDTDADFIFSTACDIAEEIQYLLLQTSF